MKKFIFELQRFDETISGSTDFEVTSGGVYTIESGYTGTIKINTTDAVTIDGSSAGELSTVNILVESDIADLTIKDLKFNFSSYYSNSPIQFGVGVGNKLTILGDNSFNLNLNDIGINIGGGLEITDASTGTLSVSSTSTASDTPCIGTSKKATSSADIIINGGIINVTNDGYGAGIGSGAYGSMGNIIINDGTITAISKYGAGIGCGANSTVESIVLNGGTMDSTSNFGAGIGSGYGGEGKSTASSVGSIKITGGDITATSKKGAGIGSGDGYSASEGFGSTVNEILISGGKIKSSGTGGEGSSSVTRTSGAGVGSGYRGTVGNITINGTADIEATSEDGAGIGTAFSALSPYTSVGDITIGGQATVKASSENNGSGIGTGEVYYVGKAEVGNITITDNAVVTATSGGQGAGIGGGYTERGKVNSENHSTSTVGNISIDGDAVIVATNSENGVGIGAGNKDSDSVNTVGTIILSGDTSTSDKSTVTINNGDTTKELTINGKTFSGAQLVFEDGVSNSSESESGGDDDTTDKVNYTITVSATGQVMLQEDGVIKIGESVYKAVFGENTTVKPTDGTLPYYPATGLQLSGNLGSKTIALENNSSSAIILKDSTGKNLVSGLGNGGDRS